MFAVAVPALALGKTNHGNHCGKGHAKHSKAVGKTCAKHNAKPSKAAIRHAAVAENETTATEQNEDQAGTTDKADAKDPTEQADDTNE
ncbi:MAG: hypothetical protein QOI42_1201, partial [Frankiaceae bacterium]|nr:hypothetical protein [Frankiaceae bacterium]